MRLSLVKAGQAVVIGRTGCYQSNPSEPSVLYIHMKDDLRVHRIANSAEDWPF